VNSRTSFGVSLRYLEYDKEWSEKAYESKYRYELKNLGAELGVRREFLSGVNLGALLGYDSFEPEEGSSLSHSYVARLSAQSAINIEHKLKLGLETIFRLERADFMKSESGKES
jgi:hypothetical protein